MMIALTDRDTVLESLSKEKTDKIVNLLGLSDVAYGDFFSSEECTFYEFYFDVLLQQKAPLAICTDWKWHPKDIFLQLNESILGDGLRLIAVHNDPNYLAFNVVYTDGIDATNMKVGFADPNQLLVSLKGYPSYLTGRKFIAVNFSEDSYQWLIVPEVFDIEAFKQLTGLQEDEYEPAPPLQPRYDSRRPNLKVDFEQPQKLFFLPTIIYIEDDHTAFRVQYRKSKEHGRGGDTNVSRVSSQVWAGRILPGQTAKEGIASELKEELSYVGRFDYTFAGYESTLKDKQGKDIHRYNLGIFLYDKTFADETKGGYKIELQKISGFDINLFKSNMY